MSNAVQVLTSQPLIRGCVIPTVRGAMFWSHRYLTVEPIGHCVVCL